MVITSRKEARDQGADTYLTGIPCKNDHISFRRTNNGGCIACEKLYNRVREPRTKRYMKTAPDKTAELPERKDHALNKEIFDKGCKLLHKLPHNVLAMAIYSWRFIDC